MLEDLIRSPEQPSLDESLAYEIPNFDDEDDLFREADCSPRALSSTNNGVCSSDVPVTITFPEPDINIADLPDYDNSFDSELISTLLNPLPPPELEPNSFPSLPAASMAAIHPMDQPNPMICNPPITSYPPNSVMSQLPLDPLGLPGYMGMEPSTMQHMSFMDANGGMGGQLYAERMRMPTWVANDGMGIYNNVGMPVMPMETAEACDLRGIYTCEAMSRLYNPINLQVLGDNQHVRPMCGTSTAPLQMPSIIPTMDDSKYKVSRISAEKRREKIERFRMKKKKRNFSKTIKYACRKALADSRPRVRGRFAKIEKSSDVVPMPSSAKDEEEYFSSLLADEIPNFDYEDDLFREAGYSPRALSSTNNGVCSSDVPVTITFPESDINITDLPGYENSFNSGLTSSLLHPLPPPEPEPNSFPSLPAASMAAIHPMDQPNPMICNPPFTSYPPNSVMSHLSVESMSSNWPATRPSAPMQQASSAVAQTKMAGGIGWRKGSY